jgi:DNA-directed RNA polymerase sigma subunit (sigma70/sigma32)
VNDLGDNMGGVAPKELNAAARRALERAIEADRAMRAAEAERKRQQVLRARALVAARNAGASLADIAAELGVTPQRVDQMTRVVADPEEE